MVKRISPSDVQVGMRIQGFDGPWLQHPFWRSRFEIRTEHQRERIRRSAVTAVLIDDSFSVAVTEATADAPDALVCAALADTPRRYKPSPLGSAEDQGRAQMLLAKSKRQITAVFSDLRMGRLVDPNDLAPLVTEISDVIMGSSNALHNILSLKTRDEYTYMHSVAVCAMMMKFARRLGFSEDEVADLGLAGLLHDVGKALMPEEILGKKGQLDDDEFRLMKQHPELGFRELAKAPGMPEQVLDVCLHHHEKIDGNGYPNRLGASGISLPARMGAICDVYDALTSDRCYKDAWTPQHALRRMSDWHGHFDTELLAAFQEVLGIYPVGARLQLVNGDEAIVVGESPNTAVHGVRIVGRERYNAEGHPIVENIKSDSIAGLSQRPRLPGLPAV